MFSFFFFLPIIFVWILVSYQTIGGVNSWSLILGLTFFVVPNWVSHELIPEAWLKGEPRLKRIIWVSFFRDRKMEVRFRVFFLLAGVFVGAVSYVTNAAWGGGAFLVTIVSASAGTFIVLHLVSVYFKEQEIEGRMSSG